MWEPQGIGTFFNSHAKQLAETDKNFGYQFFKKAGLCFLENFIVCLITALWPCTAKHTTELKEPPCDGSKGLWMISSFLAVAASGSFVPMQRCHSPFINYNQELWAQV